MKELIEILAALEHERWSNWMRWEHRLDATDEDRVRWQRQMETPYNALTEQEKESDRKEVRKTIKAIVDFMLCG